MQAMPVGTSVRYMPVTRDNKLTEADSMSMCDIPRHIHLRIELPDSIAMNSVRCGL